MTKEKLVALLAKVPNGAEVRGYGADTGGLDAVVTSNIDISQVDWFDDHDGKYRKIWLISAHNLPRQDGVFAGEWRFNGNVLSAKEAEEIYEKFGVPMPKEVVTPPPPPMPNFANHATGNFGALYGMPTPFLNAAPMPEVLTWNTNHDAVLLEPEIGEDLADEEDELDEEGPLF